MNWLIISLPLAASLSLLLATAGLFVSVKYLFKDVKVPTVQKEEPDINKVKQAFARIFPERSVPKVSVSSGEISAPKDVKLLGTAVGVKSLALLKVNGKTLIIEEGDAKMGVKLKKVLRNEAIVEIKGHQLRLKVKPTKSSRSSARPDFSESTSGFSDVRISRREIERITKDPGIMFREIRLVPFVKNGRTEGFIFEWIKPGSLFYKAGLRKGDILISINNMSIRSGEDAFRLLQVLRNEPSLRVVVLRNGQRKEIKVRIE